MKTIKTIPEGWSAQLGQGSTGWFAGVLVRPDRDKVHVEDLGERDSLVGARLRPGRSDAEWLKALREPVRLSVVLIGVEEEASVATVTEAERIWGPAAAARTEAAALLAWTERRAGRWRLVCQRDEEQWTVTESGHVLNEPAVAEAAGSVVLACQEMTSEGPRALVVDGRGEAMHSASGRCPRLASLGERICLIYERPAADSCTIRFVELADGKPVRECDLPSGDDLNMAASIAAEAEGAVFVVHEACPAWGHDHFLGRHRDLYLWRLDRTSDRFVAAPGRLPLLPRASHDLNEPPVQPRVLLVDGRPAVAFRRFEYWAARPFSWHVYLTRFDGYAWSTPARISERHGLPEVDYDFLCDDGGLLSAFTYCDQRPPLTREDIESGRDARGMPGRVHNTFVAVQRLAADTDLGPVPSLPNRLQGQYHISLGARAVAPAPERNAPGSAPKMLVWGDLHQHTLWSKCMSPVDGTRAENLRYQRDVLGCRVFSFGEHTTMMGDSEFTFYLEQMEAEAGADGVALFGCEPWSAGHDTNLYAIDRDVFTRLRLIYLRHRHLGDIMREVAKQFSPGEVACIRHFHGPTRAFVREQYGESPRGRWGTDDPRVVETFMPEIEPAMEAMQIRGNVMMGETGAHAHRLPAFPVNFLNAGCRVGLVGGTDHSSDAGPNHFCLTGFWVDELTPEAVWRALWNRKTVAVSNGKIGIWAECEGKAIGEEVVSGGAVRVRLWLSAARPVRRVTLLRDGEVLGWERVGARAAELELIDAAPLSGPHWYSVTAEAESSPDLPRPVLGHASPVFVRVG